MTTSPATTQVAPATVLRSPRETAEQCEGECDAGRADVKLWTASTSILVRFDIDASPEYHCQWASVVKLIAVLNAPSAPIPAAR